LLPQSLESGGGAISILLIGGSALLLATSLSFSTAEACAEIGASGGPFCQGNFQLLLWW
jgi:hypothetical protein